MDGTSAISVEDSWNDWFKYQTLYNLVYFDDAGEKHEIGSVKIGQFHMKEGQKRPDLPGTFERLEKRFFLARPGCRLLLGGDGFRTGDSNVVSRCTQRHHR